MEFVISDTHFYHKNIINYCHRPFNNIDYMNNYMIKKWNSIIKNDDTIYHLGDFALGWDKSNFKTKKECYKDLMNKLNGNKILIKGNHDRETDNFYKEIGFKEVYNYLEIDDILLIHYPIVIKNEQYMKEKLLKFISQFNINKYRLVIHGHVHNSNYQLQKHLNVSVEKINYLPIKLNNYKNIF